MAKIRILGPKTLLPAVIEALQGLGAIHIESRPLEMTEETSLMRRYVVEAVAQHTKETLESLLEQVKRVLLVLPPAPEALSPESALLPREAGEASLKRISLQLKPLSERVEALVKKRRSYEDELSLLARYEKVLRALSPLISMVRESRDLEYLGVAIQAEGRDVIPLLEQALDRITGGHYEVLYAPADRETLAALLVFPKEKAVEVKALLWEENIGELRLPTSITDKPFAEALRIILRKRAELPDRVRRLERELAELSLRWSPTLHQLRGWLQNKIDQITVSASFYQTRMTFIIHGWIPVKDLPGLQAHLPEVFGTRVVLEQLPIHESEQAQIPVTLTNPAAIRPFEVFTRILPLPRYGTIDPTPFIAAFFPLFFGMIVGDIGYGLIMLITALVVRRRWGSPPLTRDLAAVFSWAAVSSILWGVAYGELFGDLGERLGIRPLFLNRLEDFVPLLFFAVALGVFHVLLGISLGIITALRHGRRREVVAKSTGLVLVVAFLILMAGILGWLPRGAISVGSILALASLPVLILGGGPSAAMEIHNLVNILSYLRLMGIGIASVALAFAANKLGSLVGNLALGILIGSVLHMINVVFGIISPTIQSLRLHYVEFFENFFEGGGREYRPFRRVA